jgi:nickel transport system substrate-binding protein
MIRKRWSILGSFAVALVMILIGTVSGGTLAAGGGTLTFSWPGNVGPLNPHLYSPNQMFAQAMVYEPLVSYGEGGRMVPCLAESWKVSPNGKEYVFTLRRNVQFSDGTPFDATAVKKNFDAILANAKRHAWLDFVNQIQEVVVVDPHTAKLVLKNPYYPAIQELALIRPFRFLSPSAFPESGKTAEGIKGPIGTGPWMLVETRLGEYDLFKRNERYWGQKPGVERIMVKVIPDPNSRAVAFETGQIDLIYGSDQVTLDTFNRMRESGKYQTLISQPLASRLLCLNSNWGPSRELRVRRAILQATNKAAIVKGIFLNTEKQAETLFSPNVPYCNLDLEPFRYDPAKAEKELDQAGWKRDPAKPFRIKDGRTLEIDLCFVGNDAIQKAIVEVIQADLRRVGIKVNLLGEEKDSFLQRQKDGEFGMIFGDTWGAPYDPHSFVSSMRVPSHADYQAQLGLPNKAEIDAKISEVLITTDEKRRQGLYREILSSLHEQAVYLPLTYQTNVSVNRDDLMGVIQGHTKYEIPFALMRKK